MKPTHKQPTQSYQDIIQDKVLNRLKLARQLATQDQTNQAIKEYNKILFLDAENLMAQQELAHLYATIGDNTGCINLLQRTIQTHYTAEREEKLQQQIILRGYALLEQGDWNNFLEGTEHERFGTYLQLHLRDIETIRNDKETDNSGLQLFIHSHCYALTNHLVYALQEVEQALKMNCHRIEYFLMRGKLLWALSKEPEGNLDYWKAHALDPEHPEIVEFLGRVIPKTNLIVQETKFLIVQNSVDRCQLNIKRGLELYPENTELLLIKSYLHRSGGEYEQALKDLDVCLRTNKNNAQEDQINHQIALTYNEMAMFLFQKNKYEDALTLFNEAQFIFLQVFLFSLKYKPQDWGILVNRADAKKELKRIDEALLDYDSALKLSNNKPEVVQRMTQILYVASIESFNKGNYGKALQIFNQALELSPQSPELLLKRGRCYLELQKYQLALLDFQSTVTLDPQNFEAQNFITQMKAMKNDNKKNQIIINKDE